MKTLLFPFQLILVTVLSALTFQLLTLEQATAGTLEFECPRYMRGKTKEECLKDASEQLKKIGCEVDHEGMKTVPFKCGSGENRVTCGMVIMTNCAYAGKDLEKVYSHQSAQKLCAKTYGQKAIYKANEDKSAMFKGVCKVMSAKPVSSSGKKSKK